MNDLPLSLERELARLGILFPEETKINVPKAEPKAPKAPPWDGKGECPF